ncbi:hypothetical protein KAFR_0E02590 [Kazachstania africana CBS 2517]|uniref:Glucosidase 2 subunit beta n=1 Tax=Kazachstania africana (strain ATCC 22294 / BCRC 22015 / CBS 2517 / CECT 1963 / NBRC 1671 / NRRL Y-8276) TaxID=1071382 RepID=H2AVL2_KAZAF|nr:hypothetical protein KAFR_0E02590 [Kazachstania africana CBS 2517]CCF58412.1 hypothetical protein KAFR_0E02590 [Kazachstania africana CBS 2517]
MKAITLLLTASSVSTLGLVEATLPKVRGVPPSKQHLYEPSSNGTWKCLNSQDIVLNYSQINDGICDCPDGSDEPGTAACVDTLESQLFYCENEGFIPRFIRGTFVDDGICDCCDCSDESNLHGNTCGTLREVFEDIVQTELKKFEEGKVELIQLMKTYGIDISDKENDELVSKRNRDVEMAVLKDDIDHLKREQLRNEMILDQERENLLNRLQMENPILYQFENIDMTLILNTLKEYYHKIAKISDAYTDLTEVLIALSKTYTRSLNDKVVNENVKIFEQKFYSRELEKIAANGKVDLEQLDQLIVYFTDELPNIFWERKFDKPAEYVQNKVKFVYALIDGKVVYTETLKNLINIFSKNMEDISENYNVNFQDSGVISAVNAYREYSSKYDATLKRAALELPSNFVQEMEKLVNLVESHAETLIPEKTEEEVGQFNKILGYVNKFGSTKLESLREQTNAHRMEVENLQKQIDSKMNKYDQLLNASKEENIGGTSQEDMIPLEQINELLEKMGDSFKIGQLLDNYRYEISLNTQDNNGDIYQREDRTNGNSVKIGHLKSVSFDKRYNLHKFIDDVRLKYSGDNIIQHLTSDEATLGDHSYLFGNLQDINNGLVFEYVNGDKCWNGPYRSAKVSIKCAKDFEIFNVHEITKCNYLIDAAGPIGCNVNFKYMPHETR